MKTTHQLVQKHIAHSASLATDPLRFSSEVIKITRRMAERISADPALLAFTSHFARADSLISGFNGELWGLRRWGCLGARITALEGVRPRTFNISSIKSYALKYGNSEQNVEGAFRDK